MAAVPLFRRTLDRLIHEATADQVARLTSVTAVATRVKLSCAGIGIALLVAGVLLPTGSRSR